MMEWIRFRRLVGMCFVCCVISASGRAGDPATPLPKLRDAITIKAVNFAEYRAAIAKHRGQVVVVDAWASWCSPCLRSYPHFVRLHRQYQRKGVACISLCVEGMGRNNVERTLPRIRRFLESQGSDAENLLAKETLSELSASDKLAVAQIPAVFVYDANGKTVRVFSPSYNLSPAEMYEAVTAYVEELLESKS